MTIEPLTKVYPTVVHLLADAAEQQPSREALCCGDRRITYAEYYRCVVGFSRELAKLGVAGERVAMVMGNSVELCIAMFAVQAAGAQLAPLNPIYSEYELTPIIEDTDARVVIYEHGCAGVVKPIADNLGIQHRICVGGESGQDLLRWRDQEQLPLPTPAELPSANSLAFLLFTGGTTGRSKGVNITHYAITHQATQCGRLVPSLDEHERTLCVMPLFHIYAIMMCLHNMTYCRGTLVILPKYHPDKVFDLLVSERITILAGGPSLFTGLMSHERFADTDFSQLRLSYSGSAALPEDVLRRWEERTGAPVLEGYGQSETAGAVTFNTFTERKPGTVGLALPGTEIQVVDLTSGEPVVPGETGEIRVRGPQIMSGYRKRPDETAETLRDGWLYTSDIGRLDEEGYLTICDRKKDMVIISGFNVYPREIEEVLRLYPVVQEAAVVGVADDYRGEVLRAFVVLQQGQRVEPEELAQYCSERLARYKRPMEYRVVDALPKTTIGKIDKNRLRQSPEFTT